MDEVFQHTIWIYSSLLLYVCIKLVIQGLISFSEKKVNDILYSFKQLTHFAEFNLLLFVSNCFKHKLKYVVLQNSNRYIMRRIIELEPKFHWLLCII